MPRRFTPCPTSRPKQRHEQTDAGPAVRGGAVGILVGAAAGSVAGWLADRNRAGVNADFLDDVGAALTPGKYAVVADISEEWVTPVDTRMEALGGVVFRAARKSVEHEHRVSDQAGLRAEIAALKAEHAKSHAERKAKLQAKIDRLTAKLRSKETEANPDRSR